MLYKKDIQYINYYSKKLSTITLKWDVEKGFNTFHKATRAVSEAGQNPTEFIYIKFKKQFYAVSYDEKYRQIVISQDYIWYRINPFFGLRKMDRNEIARITRYNSYYKPPYKIEKLDDKNEWNQKLYEDFKEFDPQITCMTFDKEVIENKQAKNSVVAFAGAMFKTGIPVFELNCMDAYFKNKPSHWKLGSRGIKTFNPYLGVVTRKYDRTPYTYKEYLRKS